MDKKHRVILSADERTHVHTLLTSGTLPVRTLKRAQMLLKADESPDGPSWTDATIAQAFDVHTMTVVGVRQRYVEHGVDAVLHGRYTGYNPAIVTGEVEAQLIALTCSPAPHGRDH